MRQIFLTALLAAVMSPAAAVERVERGNLVIEDIPEIPAELAARMNQYQQVRTASFSGWLGREGALITTRFGETAQVHRVAFPMGMREQLTFYPEPVGGVVVAPDGKSFLFAKDTGGSEFYQLYHYELASGKVTLTTDGKSRNTGARWCNDGGRFAFSTTRRNGRDTDIHIRALNAEASVPVLEREGNWSVEDWSPDDRSLMVSKNISINESELYLLDLETRALTRFHPAREPIAFSQALFSRDGLGVYYVSDENAEFRQLRYEDLKTGENTILTASIPWDIEEIALSRGGTYLAYLSNAGGVSELHLRDLKKERVVSAPPLPSGVMGGLEFDPTGRQLGFFLNNARNPTDVFSFEIGGAILTRWTKSETGGLNAASFTEPALIEFKSFDERRIPAFYYRPASAAGVKAPVLINIHGGPEAQSLPVFAPLTEFYVRELGIAVLYPNVRGSEGYGKSYLKLDNGFKREDSVKDIGALLDWIAQQPELDASRVAVIGGSYGGYMALASMTTYNDRLRAGIDIVGISNFVTFLKNTQDYRRDLRRVEYGDERDEAMRQYLENISPTRNARKITKPMFIVQGANDPRVPASEAEQMVQTIRKQGGDVWYLLAKDEGHGFQKKANRDFYTNAVVLFLQKHLLN